MDRQENEQAVFLEELHGYGLEAFKALEQFCREHNLQYFAIGGTLLGAVRHQGFIPWDDDMDVGMPRPDYDRLVSLAKEFPKPFVLEEYRHSKGFQSYFAKIRNETIGLLETVTESKDERPGYLIDIIPMDGTPDSVLLRKFYFIRVLLLRFLCGAANVHTGILTSRPKWEQKVLKVCRMLRLYKVLKVEKIYRRMDRLFHKQNALCAKHIGTITGAYKTREIVPAEYFGIEEEPVYLPFEDTSIRVPKNYEPYLTHMYGEYMQLPPEEQRKAHYQGKIQKYGTGYSVRTGMDSRNPSEK
ncbi:MAG: LicD family protein [Lachnospiraceae bacterium]|nr:LicD family protein [Lachnospiraceae bacterium]